MAYVSTETKAELAPGIKAVLKKYGVKGTIKVDRYSTLVVTLRQIPAGLFTPTQISERSVNEHWIEEHFEGKTKDFLLELKDAMKGPNWFDKSDSMVDYFHVAWYTSIRIGEWNKPAVII